MRLIEDFFHASGPSLLLLLLVFIRDVSGTNYALALQVLLGVLGLVPPIAATIRLLVSLFCHKMIHIREREVAAAELVRASVVLLKNVASALLHSLIAPRHDVRIDDPLLLLAECQLRWHKLGPRQKT